MGKLLPEEYLTDSEYQKIAKKLIFDNCNAEISHHICNDPTKFGVVVKQEKGQRLFVKNTL